MSQSRPSANGASSVEDLKAVAGTLGYIDRLDRLVTDLELRAGIIQPPEPSDDEDDDEEPPKTVPQVRECDWEHFINRFDPAEPVYSIEVLVAGTKIRQDIAAEARKRMPKQVLGPKTSRPPPFRVHRLESNSKWIQRVRIQSPTLLAAFGRVTGYDWGTQPHTFMRPFPDLIYYHGKLRDELRILDSDEPPTGPSPAPREDLRCYIDFVEQRLLPDYTRIREATELNRPRVLFSDLWYLFKPGDFVFVPPKSLLNSAVEEMKQNSTERITGLRESPWHQRMLLTLPYSLTFPRGYAWLTFENAHQACGGYLSPRSRRRRHRCNSHEGGTEIVMILTTKTAREYGTLLLEPCAITWTTTERPMGRSNGHFESTIMRVRKTSES